MYCVLQQEAQHALQDGDKRFNELGQERKSHQAHDNQLREIRKELRQQHDRRRSAYQQIKAKQNA